MVVSKILIMDENKDNQAFFKGLLERWDMEVQPVTDIENSLIRINIMKPNLILISFDLKVNYENVFNFLYNRAFQLMGYGFSRNNKTLPRFQTLQIFHGFHELPLNIARFKKNLFTLLKKNLLESKPSSHIDFLLNDQVCVIELSGSFNWEEIHELKYRIIYQYRKEVTKGTLIIFHKIENGVEELKELLPHLLSFIADLMLDMNSIKLLTNSADIQSIIKSDMAYRNIEFVQSYTEGLLQIQSLSMNKNTLGMDIDFIKDNFTKLVEDVFDEFVTVVKKAGETFSKEEIADLKKQNITRLYYAKELSYLGVGLDTISEVRKTVEDIIIKQVELSQEEKVEESKSGKKQILIVEDDEPTQKIFVKIVEKLGYSVVIAGNGLDALKNAIQFNPNLIILDLMVPKMNGVEFFKKYKELRKNSAAPVIVTSAVNRSDVIQSMLKLGVKEYLVKPFDINVLEEKIRNHLH